MSDTGAIAAAGSYRDFLKEVFIDPIRTAVVVDDEYPTLDDLVCLNDEKASDGEANSQLSSEKRQNKGTVKKIIDLCRGRSPTPWLVDVHDGTTPKSRSSCPAATGVVGRSASGRRIDRIGAVAGSVCGGSADGPADAAIVRSVSAS